MTQKERVLRHIESFGSITSLEAFKDYGITRLSAIIYELRKEFDIESERQSVLNRYGESVSFARYYLKKEGER